MFEFGDGQEADVSELISASEGLRMVDVKCDLQGIRTDRDCKTQKLKPET